jgi:hypothetical protein
VPGYGQELRFGIFIPPGAEQAGAVLELAQLADAVGLDYVTFQRDLIEQVGRGNADPAAVRSFLTAWRGPTLRMLGRSPPAAPTAPRHPR